MLERIETSGDDLHFAEHLARYRFAFEHLRPGATLDLATGSGYGADALAGLDLGAVAGVDVDAAVLSAARRSYGRRGLSYLAADGTALPFRDGAFGNVVSFETIEHVEDDEGFLAEIRRVLVPGGVLVLSTPNRAYGERHGCVSPFHVREYDRGQLLALVGRHFGALRLFEQGFAHSYHRRAAEHADAIRAGKRRLPLPVRLAIEASRPLRRALPVAASNYFIQRWLGLRHPRPEAREIRISAAALDDPAVFVLVGEKI
jgi:SAM-dependent methyltransferase